MRKKVEKIMVCAMCGHSVIKCDHSWGKFYFCGNCGENGSHQEAVDSKKWIKARKIMGLPSKINSF